MSKVVKTTAVVDPHDTFFRQLLSDPSVALDLVQNYLPADLLPLLDLSQLRMEKDTFVDARLRKHFSDVLYSVPLKNNPPLALPPAAETIEKPAKKKRKRTPAPTVEARVYHICCLNTKASRIKGCGCNCCAT